MQERSCDTTLAVESLERSSPVGGSSPARVSPNSSAAAGSQSAAAEALQVPPAESVRSSGARTDGQRQVQLKHGARVSLKKAATNRKACEDKVAKQEG